MKKFLSMVAFGIAIFFCVPCAAMSRVRNGIAMIRYYSMPTSLNPKTWFNNNYGTVIDGQVYRSKTLSPLVLETLIDEKKIKTILNLREDHGFWYNLERAVADKKGVELVTVTLDGNKLPTREQLKKIYDVLIDPEKRAVLIHCIAGADRTGMIAAFCTLINGKSLEEALAQQTPANCHFEWRYPLMRHCTKTLARLKEENSTMSWEQIIDVYDHEAVRAQIQKTLPSMPKRIFSALKSTVKENPKMSLALGATALLLGAGAYAYKKGKLAKAWQSIKGMVS